MDHDHHPAASDITEGAETAKDPVCGMTVAVKPDTRHAVFQGEAFHFCSEKCTTKFEADPVKETTPNALKELHALGFRIIMATGDNERTAKAVAGRLGIDEIRAEVLPEDKARIIKALQAEGRRVAMAGNGVNDAPALAQAEVGIAMGTGADVAIENAGFTLVKGDLNGVVRARRLSLATMRNIRQNLFFAMVYNAAGVPVAAGVLYPVLGILISPIFAAFAMTASSLSVVLNALRLRTVKV